MKEDDRFDSFMSDNKRVLFNEFVQDHYDEFLVFAKEQFHNVFRSRKYKVD